MIFLLIPLLIIVCYKIFISHDLMHPFLFFLIPWILILSTQVLDVYGIASQTSTLAVEIVSVGIGSYIIGVVLVPTALMQSKSKRSIPVRISQYRGCLLYFIIFFTAIFNLYMSYITISYIREGTSYAYVRDLIYAYNDTGATYFQSGLALNVYNLIDVPFTYILTPLVIINLFHNTLPRGTKYLAILSLAAYIFATGGRLILLFAAFQVVAVVGYFNKKISWRKYILAICVGGLILLVVAIASLYRAKEVSLGATSVNPGYAYFNIVLPILSKWAREVSVSGIHGYGYGFFNGFMQLFELISQKIGISLPGYESLIPTLTMPQNNWIQIYSGQWYNAFASMFYEFYVDFRIPGVIVGSFIFGLLSKTLYIFARFSMSRRFLLPYLVLIETMVGSFMRWQLGTYTFLSALIISFFIYKDVSKYPFGEEEKS